MPKTTLTRTFHLTAIVLLACGTFLTRVPGAAAADTAAAATGTAPAGEAHIGAPDMSSRGMGAQDAGADHVDAHAGGNHRQQSGRGSATRKPVSGAEAAFLKESNAAMERMMADMTPTPTGDVDRDFVAMMIPHHQGAIDMAKAVLRSGKNATIRRLAQEIIVTQQDEIRVMRQAVGGAGAASPQPSAGSPAPAKPRMEH